MQISCDREADAVAIWFGDRLTCNTIDLRKDIFANLVEDGELAGIKGLHAS